MKTATPFFQSHSVVLVDSKYLQDQKRKGKDINNIILESYESEVIEHHRG